MLEKLGAWRQSRPGAARGCGREGGTGGAWTNLSFWQGCASIVWTHVICPNPQMIQSRVDPKVSGGLDLIITYPRWFVSCPACTTPEQDVTSRGNVGWGRVREYMGILCSLPLLELLTHRVSWLEKKLVSSISVTEKCPANSKAERQLHWTDHRRLVCLVAARTSSWCSDSSLPHAPLPFVILVEGIPASYHLA